LKGHSDVNVVCRQRICHYAAPLLGGIKANATRRHTIPVITLFIQCYNTLDVPKVAVK